MNQEYLINLNKQGFKTKQIYEKVLLYLRLLHINEDTISFILKDIMHRFLNQKKNEDIDYDSLALKIVKDVILEHNISPNDSYNQIFSDAYLKNISRTSFSYHDIDSEKNNSNNQNQRRCLYFRRTMFMSFVMISTLMGIWAITNILTVHGLTFLRFLIICVFSFLFGWISINFWSSLFGFFADMRKEEKFLKLPDSASSISSNVKTAIIMPIHNEEVHSIFARIRAIYESITELKTVQNFDFFILSDSSSQSHIIKEQLYWAKLCNDVNGFGKIFYRLRKIRQHKKSGNVGDFCRRWGKLYKYMITLDADSLMSANELVRMVNMMEIRNDIGILQTSPMAVNQSSFLSTLQQFSNHAYGPIFFSGLRFWQMDETGFWGHNAIIRLDAFIKYCALPSLKGGPPFGGEILSHDFIEASLMRRAGYGVWLAHEFKETYEELPPNLLEELSRDKRWCQGNIQHLRLIFMKGITLGHRILFIQGNLFYFSSLMWLILLILMTTNASLLYFQKHVYFLNERTLFPLWVVERRELSFTVLVVTIVFLFAPKILSILHIVYLKRRAFEFGGVFKLILSVILETLFSTILAPIRMVFHSWYCLLNLTGRKLTWGTQVRLHKKTSFKEAFRAHFIWTLIALFWAVFAYTISEAVFWWLSMILLPLIFAIPISILFSYTSIGKFFKKLGLFLSPPETKPSKILKIYQSYLDKKNDCLED